MKTENKQLIILSLVFIPGAFIHNYFHEFGHWLVGEILGYDMGISLNGVWPKNGDYSHVSHGLYVGIGGPAFSILMALIFMIIIEKSELIYLFPLVFYPFYSRLFSLTIGEFSLQDEGNISAIMNLGTYTIAAFVLLALGVIVWRANYRLKFGFKHVGLFFIAATLSKAFEIFIIQYS